MIETVKEHCKHKDCAHRMVIANCAHICAYILHENKPRGCDISQCDKYRKRGVN